MNTELFIAKRLFSAKETKKSISNAVVTIAIVGIALGMVVMILSIAIVTGFKQQVSEKVTGFASHIIISNYDINSSYETEPIWKNQNFYPDIKDIPGYKHIQVFALKAGIVKTKTDIQGVILKGIGSDFNWGFFKESLVEGKIFAVNENVKNDSVIISKHIATLLKLKVDAPLFMYFINKKGKTKNPVKQRRFTISGIYNTGLEEFDKSFVICDIKQVQKLNDWTNNQVSGFEITIDNFDELLPMTEKTYEQVGTVYEKDTEQLQIRSIKDNFPHIFDWLALSDTNVWIILVLMLLVGGFNMISGLLVIILERTNMIGILKALGAKNANIRKIFLYNASFLIGKGMIWGNLIGISLCLVQYQFGIIKLDPSTYYIDAVPINLKIFHLILLNIGTLIVTTAMLILPSMFISKISPAKAIRFS
ncbi:MAG: ABC transporter permease [Bacteroidetes bacterium]|nr:MAG: ABC transporter permease [Bacteroidota bacterium]